MNPLDYMIPAGLRHQLATAGNPQNNAIQSKGPPINFNDTWTNVPGGVVHQGTALGFAADGSGASPGAGFQQVQPGVFRKDLTQYNPVSKDSGFLPLIGMGAGMALTGNALPILGAAQNQSSQQGGSLINSPAQNALRPQMNPAILQFMQRSMLMNMLKQRMSGMNGANGMNGMMRPL